MKTETVILIILIAIIIVYFLLKREGYDDPTSASECLKMYYKCLIDKGDGGECEYLYSKCANVNHPSWIVRDQYN